MIRKVSVLASAAVLTFFASSSHAAQLLLNGSFEAPTVTAGNHVGTLPTSWTVLTSAGAPNTGNSNLFSGTSSDTTGGVTTTLGPDPYDTGNTNSQSLDINGNGLADQTFTAQFSTPVTIKIDFGARASIAKTTNSFWTLYNSTGTTVIATGATIVTTPGSWTSQTTTTPVSLAAGTQYLFQVTLDNADQVDGISVNQVPEPSTLAAAGIGAALLGWVSIKRRRRA